MPQPPARLIVDGASETSRALKAVGGRELQRELGEVHKKIGTMIITAAGGKRTGVGEGAGASIRPSAASREVTLRVGGKHRDSRKDQWGKRQLWPAPERPYLIGAAVSIQGEIEKAYLEGVMEILDDKLPNYV